MNVTDEMIVLVLRERVDAIRKEAQFYSPVRSVKDAHEFVKKAMPLFVEMRAILRERENAEAKK